jgi:hypothetical protein
MLCDAKQDETKSHGDDGDEDDDDDDDDENVNTVGRLDLIYGRRRMTTIV